MTNRPLLLIAHGSRSNQWNKEIVTFTEHIGAALPNTGTFDSTHCCFLEYADPSIAEAVQTLATAPSLVALPLFLSVSEHVIVDIPREMEAAATLIKEEKTYRLYRRKNTPIYLLKPPPTAELLAANLARRYLHHTHCSQKPNLLLVFYGSKNYLGSWDDLCRNVQEALTARLPETVVDWEYGGDAVGFSPEPIAHKIRELAEESDSVVVLPALVSRGIIQTDVIPQAIKLSGLKDRVLYPQDAVLPDPILAQTVLYYAVETFRDICD